MKLKVKVRRYRAEEMRFGPVTLGVLVLAGEEEREVRARDPVEAMLGAVEELGRTRYQDGYIEVFVEGGEPRLVHGEKVGYRWRRRLAMRPTRLRRVGVIRRGHLAPLKGGVDAYKVKLDSVEWHDAPDGVYVYEGKLEVDGDDVVLVVLDTEDGRYYLRPPASSRSSRSSQPRS